MIFRFQANVPHGSIDGIKERALNLITPPLKGLKILDAAAGTGIFSRLVAEQGGDVYALDINPKEFRCKGKVCKKADLNEKLPFPDEFFDVVVSLETIEHLKSPWLFVSELKRVLKPGGQLIISTPNVTNLLSRALYLFRGRVVLFSEKTIADHFHIFPLPLWLLKGICLQEGLIIKEVKYSDIYLPKLKLYIGVENPILSYVYILCAIKPDKIKKQSKLIKHKKK